MTAGESFLVGMAKAVAWVVFAIGAAIWRGYVLTILWGWFVVHAFGAQPLAIPLAIGLSMLVTFLTHSPQNPKDTDSAFIIGMAVFGPALVLFMGWIVQKFL